MSKSKMVAHSKLRKPSTVASTVNDFSATAPSNSQLVGRILVVLILAANSAYLVQLSLSPIYGSISSTQAKSWMISLPGSIGVPMPIPGALIIPLVIICSTYLSKDLQIKVRALLPILGLSLPAVLSQTFRFSGYLGPSWGPIVTSFCIIGPLILVSWLNVIDDLVKLMLLNGCGRRNQTWYLPVIVVGSYNLLDGLQTVSGTWIPQMIASWSGLSPLFSRFGLIALLSMGYGTLLASRKILAIVGSMALLHLLLYQPHLPLPYNTRLLNSALALEGYSVIARQESLTGYVSVLDNVRDHFRVMRCDHSLLGGEWTNKPVGHPAILNEPIYLIFVMLEAVRLVEWESSEMRDRAATTNRPDSALVVGLGVGTAPAALMEHGIEVTTVEIDAVVHDFAMRYFSLSDKHTSIIGDAVQVVQKLEKEKKRYDYIIHDVFTGGAEPVELFTFEFLTGLKELLHPNGTIAINYAGDLLLFSAISVIETVRSVFPNCRLFREVPQPISIGAKDYTNIVMFCRRSPEEFQFRDPVEKDFLGSPARRKHLYPQNEVHDFPSGKGRIITRKDTAEFAASQLKSAVGHWHVMRTVLPAKVWEDW